MGFFSKYNETEKNLLETYSKIFSSIGLPNAQKMTKDILDKAIEDSKKAGRYSLTNMGDTLLEKEESSGQINPNFEEKRKEGVRDEDIRWWFNLNDIERMMMLKADEFHQSSLYLSQIEAGKNEEEALTIISKYHPRYGNFKDRTFGKEDDRPLPYELKDRINIYIQKRADENSEKYKNEIEKSSTFNALIRAEMRAGKI
ncbi:MAG: hypothetical protein V1667_03725 [bacterium]